MEKNLGKLTVAAAGLAGAGAAVVLAKKASQAKKVSEPKSSPKNSGYPACAYWKLHGLLWQKGRPTVFLIS